MTVTFSFSSAIKDCVSTVLIRLANKAAREAQRVGRPRPHAGPASPLGDTSPSPTVGGLELADVAHPGTFALQG